MSTERNARAVLAMAMITIGVAHIVDPAPFVRIMPPYLPAHEPLVLISGLAEIAGGVGLLIPATRQLAGIGLIALYIAVFPANLYMATHGVQPRPDLPVPSWLAWARLPLQLALILLAWRLSRPAHPATAAPSAP